jgi:soluble lytic murein transglycosylase-like protein
MADFFDSINIEFSSGDEFSLNSGKISDAISTNSFAELIAANRFLLGIDFDSGEIAAGAQVNSQYMQAGTTPISGTGWISAAGNAVVTARKEALKAAGISIKGYTLYGEMIIRVANSMGVDPALLLGLVQAESSFNPESGSNAGAIGLCQLMPGTARALGVDPYNIEQNVRGGAKYLKQQLTEFKSVELALAAYNAGPGNVKKYKGIPPFKETQNYVPKVLRYAKAFGYKG